MLCNSSLHSSATQACTALQLKLAQLCCCLLWAQLWRKLPYKCLIPWLDCAATVVIASFTFFTGIEHVDTCCGVIYPNTETDPHICYGFILSLDYTQRHCPHVSLSSLAPDFAVTECQCATLLQSVDANPCPKVGITNPFSSQTHTKPLPLGPQVCSNQAASPSLCRKTPPPLPPFYFTLHCCLN